MLTTEPGYDIVEDVFTRAEIARVTDVLSGTPLQRTRAGARHLLSLPTVRDLSIHPSLLSIARRFIGPTPTAFRATLFDKSPGANWLVVWHQDTALPLQSRTDDPGWGPWSVKGGVTYAHAPAWALEQVVALRVSLDDSTPSNGPLRVLPGSHRSGVLSDEQIGKLARLTAPVDCICPAGGVVAMRPLTVHASSKSIGDQPRRVLHIEYASELQLRPGIDLAQA